MKWEKCQLFSFEAIEKIMEQLPGGAKASCRALLLALDSLEKPCIIRKIPNSRKGLV